MPPTDVRRPGQHLGLRERKKLQTRAAIQRHALHLFDEQGYAATTMEQIAAAADVSPSTLYRYFPTKEDLVLADDYDPMLAAAFEAQPPDMGPLEAFRAAVSATLASLPAEERADFRLKIELTFTTPEVRARALNEMLETSDVIVGLFAARTHRDPHDFALRVMAGMVIGAMLAAQQQWLTQPDRDLMEVFDEALDYVIAGPAMLDPREPRNSGKESQ